MRKILFVACMLALVIASVSITARADSQSVIQECVAATGFPTDVCANCIAFFGHDAGDAGPCLCKELRAIEPALFDALFSNLGQCVKEVQQEFH